MEKTKYAITVVVTAYNLEQYIDECFECLAFQSMQDFNILFVNDASTDKTMEMVSKWVSFFDSRLRILDLEKNTGMPALARNVALDSGLIDGEFVLFLDGDDLIEKNMLSDLYEAITKCEGADVSICAFDRVDMETGKTISTEMKGFPSEYVVSDKDDVLAFINTSPWNKLWRYSVIKELRYPSIKVGEEISFNVLGYIGSKKICFINDVLIHYSVHEDSVISNTDEKTIWDFADVLKELRNEADSRYIDLIELIIFIHIGLSMTVRAYHIKDNNMKLYFKRIYEYFDDIGLKNNKLMTLKNLSKRGIKGIFIWLSIVLYRFRAFHIFFSLGYKLLGNIRF